MAAYELLSAFEAFGERLTVAEVEERVPLILLDGGPFDGMVHDSRSIRRAEVGAEVEPGVVRYTYATEIGRLPDGRVARLFRPEAPGATDWGRDEPWW